MATQTVNEIGLEKADYKGRPTTLCQGCGHNSISSQIMAACYELSLSPEEVIKLSGIGCSSKSPAYFLSRSHGFNSLHGRMPSIGTGAVMANRSLKAIGVSGDGVDQDDVVTAAGQVGYAPPDAIRVDQYIVGSVRLPFQKFNRNPHGP